MSWQESPPKSTSVDCSIVDLVFKITGQALPIDHAYALFQGLVRPLPWIQDDQWLGIHHVHIAESGNGWIRSDDHGILQLSGRARLVVRLHINMLDSARLLCGKHIAVDKHIIEIGTAKVRPLNPLNTVSARHVVADQEIQDETKFLQWVNEQLKVVGITPTKLLCGKFSSSDSARGANWAVGCSCHIAVLMQYRIQLQRDKRTPVTYHAATRAGRIAGCRLRLSLWEISNE